jgi:hypothetical protein
MKTNEPPSMQSAEYPLSQCTSELKERLEKLKRVGAIESFETLEKPKEGGGKLLMLSVSFKM